LYFSLHSERLRLVAILNNKRTVY